MILSVLLPYCLFGRAAIGSPISGPIAQTCREPHIKSICWADMGCSDAPDTWDPARSGPPCSHCRYHKNPTHSDEP